MRVIAGFLQCDGQLPLNVLVEFLVNRSLSVIIIYALDLQSLLITVLQLDNFLTI